MRWPVVYLSCLAAIAQQTDSAAARTAALALLRQGKVAEAVPYLERVRASEPSNFEASWNLALAYSRLNRLAAARDLLRAMPRDRGEVRNLLASVEERAGRVREAAIEYQEAAHLEPSEKHIADWANHLLKHRALDSALKVYASGANMHPKSIPLRVGLGAAHYSAGNYDDAARELCAAADLDPADLRPLEFLALVIDTSPPNSEAIASRLGRYASRYPRNAKARLYYGLSVADLATREAELRAAVAIDPSLARGWLGLGTLSAERDDTAAAITALARAVRVQPDLEGAHYRLSRLYRKAGKTELAERHQAIYAKLRTRPKMQPAIVGLTVD